MMLCTPWVLARRHDGFTLVELLVVIIIIAILATIAIPTFFGTRTKANDAAAVSLVRNALTIVESVNVDMRDYTAITAVDLSTMEPNITWNVSAVDLVDPTIPAVLPAVTADASSDAVDFYAQTPTQFDIGSVSESGNRYGIQVITSGLASTAYVKVKVVDGSSSLGW